MPTIAYLANIFPASVEPYVIDEIGELQRRGITVIPSSVLRPQEEFGGSAGTLAAQTIYLRVLRISLLLQACWLMVKKGPRLGKFLRRAFQRRKPTERKLRCLVHTALGMYYAACLRNRHVDHIHAHHGYFGAWVAMVAARILQIPFSMTLHGSDLLEHAAYLDSKLQQCQFCVTISEFNRRHILAKYPEVNPEKVYVRHMGVFCSFPLPYEKPRDACLVMLAVGRLHAVKDHAFLVRACHQLKKRGLRFTCAIAGDGPERERLDALIRGLHLEQEVQLLGQLERNKVNRLYDAADLVVLTSRSEGIPLTLMEAMAHGKLVLAPSVTGIPELVIDGETGFLYHPGSQADFLAKVEMISRARSDFRDVCANAREHVAQKFNRARNLSAFCDLLIAHLRSKSDCAHTAA